MPKSKNRGITKVRIAENEPEELAEALTVKNQAKGLLRSIATLLGDKALPSGVRKSLETASEAMRKTWADLEVEANSEEKETTASETIKQEDGKWFLYSKDGKEKLGGPYDSEDEAIKREKQVLAFKDKEKENEPETEPSHIGEAYDSLDGMASKVRGAFNTQFPQLTNYGMYTSSPPSWWVKDVYHEHPELGTSIVVCDSATNKHYAIGYVMGDDGSILFAPRSEWLEVVMTYKPVVPPDKDEMAQLETAESEPSPLAESFDGADITMVEAETPALDANRAPLSIDVALIKPGFGNKKDNHYYSAEMLKTYAKVFEGAKMYLTDHKENERSVRNEVSVIDTVNRFREDGAPIARVTVFDPAFAESVRARAQAGKLDTLECSILADGTARKGMVEGREAKIVESIASVRAVDWVTRAGAGGHAMNIAESEAVPDEVLPVETPAPIAEATPAQVETVPAETPTPVLQEAQVTVVLSESGLPKDAQEWVAEGVYATDTDLKEAIVKAKERIKRLTGGGKPFAHGQTAISESTPLDPDQLEKRGQERYKRIMREIGI